MNYNIFCEQTLPYNTFSLIPCEKNGTCCYNSVLKILKIYNLVKPNLNTKIIQAKAVNWIIENQNLFLYDFHMTVKELTLLNHNLYNFQEYISNYKIYSKNTSSDQWGGIPELVALSHIYKINIFIYAPKAYNKKNNKIIKGTIINYSPRKDLRFHHIISIIENKSIFTIHILYTKIKHNVYHFDALIKDI